MCLIGPMLNPFLNLSLFKRLISDSSTTSLALLKSGASLLSSWFDEEICLGYAFLRELGGLLEDRSWAKMES